MEKSKIKIIKKGNKVVEPKILENVVKSEKNNMRQMTGAVSNWVSERSIHRQSEEVSAMKILSDWKQISSFSGNHR